MSATVPLSQAKFRPKTQDPEDIFTALYDTDMFAPSLYGRYTNCSLIKYMEKHKVKPDSKAFHLVSHGAALNRAMACSVQDLWTY